MFRYALAVAGMVAAMALAPLPARSDDADSVLAHPRRPRPSATAPT